MTLSSSNRQVSAPHTLADPAAAHLIADLEPRRWAGVYVFNSVDALYGIDAAEHIAVVKENEGWTLVSERSVAARLVLGVDPIYAGFTLETDSDLADIGLSAAISDALAQSEIACNILAGVYHDHLFIPVADADRALTVLQALQMRYRSSQSVQRPAHD